MKRNLYVARQLLEVIEENADYDGLAYAHLLSIHVGRGGSPSSEDNYHVKILLQGGFISRSPEGNGEAVMLQLTWAGHELLDQLRNTHSE